LAWLQKKRRCGFSNEDEVHDFAKRMYTEIKILEAQALLNVKPEENANIIRDSLEELMEHGISLPSKA
jgi:tetratricopeptide (TPR) repeat protein